MKHYYLISISIASIIAGCSKSGSSVTPTPTPSPARQIIFSVKGLSTNNPIAGANVSLRKCSNYDPVFGCSSYSTFTVLTTNSEGKATYSGNSSVEQVKVEADHYWTRFYTGSALSNLILSPKNIIEVAVKKETNYASTDILWIGQAKTIDDLTPIGLPVDTIVYVDGYGYTNNQIFWYINYRNSGIINTSVGGSSPLFYVNGFDTARIEIKY